MRYLIIFFLLIANIGVSQTYTLEKMQDLALSN